MAIMHPPAIDCDPQHPAGRQQRRSEAESLVFNECGRQLSIEWTVYHSVWILEGASGEHAEIDFLLVGPEAILALEVKGGLVSRSNDGRWDYRTKAGVLKKQTTRGPVEQARSAWYALRHHIRTRAGSDLADDLLWGYGVVTPECEIRLAGPDPEFPRRIWLDEAGFPDEFSDFVEHLVQYWKTDREGQHGKRPANDRIDSWSKSRLDKAIRPQVRYIQSAGTAARSASRQLIKLTEQQFKALNFASLEPRIIIQGGAGTGKTLLAEEQARRMSASGLNVLFVCFNRLLASKVASNLVGKGITVHNFHQLAKQLLRGAGLQYSVSDDWAAFNAEAPDLVLAAIDQLTEMKSFIPYDCVIIDEGQDLLARPFFDVLDLLLKGGLAEGRWLMCFDTEQAIFSSQTDPAFMSSLLADYRPFRISLDTNCRNTIQVRAYSHSISKVPSRSIAQVSGPEPEVIYFSNSHSLRRELKASVNHIVRDFRDAGLSTDRIAVLLAKRGELEPMVRDIAAETLVSGYWLTPESSLPENMYAVSTVHAFKGLEADAVIVVGLDDLADDQQRKLFYVAATRAKSILKVILPESAASAIEQSLPEIIRMLKD